MAAVVIDGTAIAGRMQEEIAAEVQGFKRDHGISPCLQVILAGNDPSSMVYVRKKQEACQRAGILSRFLHCYTGSDPMSVADTPQELLEKEIRRCNGDAAVHGILVQLPLPPVFDQFRLFDALHPSKDVDVLNPYNVGMLVQGRALLKPCTPTGIVELLRRTGIPVARQKVAVINRSNVVGKPLSSMLIQDCDEYANATVTVCHNRTPPRLLQEVTRAADIVVVAVGIPGFLTEDMVRPGQVVIDVGTNRVSNKLVGDVDYGPVSKIVRYITKVPGGVGPMTVTMLLRNTLEAAKLQVQTG